MESFSYIFVKVSGEGLPALPIRNILFPCCLLLSIDMTLDGAVRVLNQRNKVAVSLSHDGNCSALIHPNGRILQIGSKVEIVTYDGMMNNNFV